LACAKTANIGFKNMHLKHHPVVLVVGAGVAGSACAIRLRALGIDVVLAEKAVFPRTKVCGCCLGGKGLAALNEVGLHDWALDVGQPTSRWSGSLAGKRFELPLPPGIAISRQSLDTKLLQTAAAGGADVQTPCIASIHSVEADAVSVTLKTDDRLEHRRFDVVVIASGLLGSGLQKTLPWKETPHGPFGVSFTVAGDIDGFEPGVIYMACDRDGYVGLVQLEDGRVDVAAALVSGSQAAQQGTPTQRVVAILGRSSFADWSLHDPSPALTTPALRRTRQAGAGRVIAIGDAAGYVEPFTGEGMTWGMQSGIAAAELIATVPPQALGAAWQEHLDRLLKSPKRTCRMVTTALRYPLARYAAAQVLSRFPGVAAPLIRSLNRT
jgi:menaquinone-9 beta-reductase